MFGEGALDGPLCDGPLYELLEDRGALYDASRRVSKPSREASGPAVSCVQSIFQKNVAAAHSPMFTRPSVTALPCCAWPTKRSATPTQCLPNISFSSTFAMSQMLMSTFGGSLEPLNSLYAACALMVPPPDGSPTENIWSTKADSAGVGSKDVIASKARNCTKRVSIVLVRLHTHQTCARSYLRMQLFLQHRDACFETYPCIKRNYRGRFAGCKDLTKLTDVPHQQTDQAVIQAMQRDDTTRTPLHLACRFVNVIAAAREQLEHFSLLQ